MTGQLSGGCNSCELFALKVSLGRLSRPQSSRRSSVLRTVIEAAASRDGSPRVNWERVPLSPAETAFPAVPRGGRLRSEGRRVPKHSRTQLAFLLREGEGRLSMATATGHKVSACRLRVGSTLPRRRASLRQYPTHTTTRDSHVGFNACLIQNPRI